MGINAGMGVSSAESLVGTVFETFYCRVDHLAIRAFAEAVCDPNALYSDSDKAKHCGYRDIPAPPSYAFALEMTAGPGQVEICRRLGLNPAQTLHVRQSFEWHGDLCAGDELTGTTSVVSALFRNRMKTFTLETKWTNRESELILVSRSQLAEYERGQGQ